ncbi:hypothetical protein [Tsukamurella ocularis]|uniref:hypothetical protein n=1 Tax=Tsukamurella ocularis TaxID=1970234 RepID=UPI00216702AE|nr:hypothetical protein [Tsukamurella ocularis]MCS3780024.1 hypothetical protein [Tsukamurella ocularis]MCS3788576.1 hypothetical protein [Tsukamurella ocularis]MCS3849786.1 hypothetical protein [Tsukamurella ocularis]
MTNYVRHSTYRLLEVQVRIRDATTTGELRAIQDVYSERVAGRAGSGQAVAPLSIEWCEPRSASPGSTCGCPSGADVDPFRAPGNCSSLRSEPGVQVPNEQWLRLRRTDPIDHVQMAVSQSTRTIEVEAAPYKLRQTVQLVRSSFSDLVDAGWTFRSVSSTIQAPDGIPDDTVLAVWDHLGERSAATITRFRFRQSPSISDTDLVAVDMHALSIEEVRAQALRHLTVLQKLGRPVIYQATIAGNVTIDVFVNGCKRRNTGTVPTAPPPPVQEGLRSQYERC